MRTFRLIERTLLPGCCEIQVEGELDLAVADELKRAIDRAAAAHEQILIDLRRCEFIDSSAIALLVQAHNERGKEGRLVAVHGASSQVRRILSITGLTENGLVFENADEALAASDQT